MENDSTETGKKVGTEEPGSAYSIGGWLFLRLLGLVFLIAFVSLWVQIDGLVGSGGILPVADFLEQVRDHTGVERYRQLPTLLWLADGDLALHILCGGGTLLSLALIAGLAPLPVLASLWVCYLSVTIGGQTFLGFQWDSLLLETGFCALFVVPSTWRTPSRRPFPVPPRAGLWLVWLLLFKLMFLSGAVKPLSMDDTWWNLEALDYHYWTQPLPTWTSWYAHRLPGWFQELSTLVTYAIEIVLPFLVFAGRIGRRVVAAGTVFLMLMISATGNFGFFNLLTVVLCVPLVDDACFGRPLPRATPSRSRRLARVTRVALVAVVIAISALTLVQELVLTVPPQTGGTGAALTGGARRWILSWSQPTILRWTAPFRSINGYGLFRSMTTERPEIAVEGSRNGQTWVAYEFKWKPGDPARRPRFVAPHMPRLDWQMWFAALNPRRAEHWLGGLMGGILRGSPAVLGLLRSDPFPDDPPRYIRLMVYKYRFATAAERRDTGAWWMRELVGPLTPALSLEQL